MAREFVFFALESAFGTPMTPTAPEMWTIGGSGTAGVGVAGFAGFYGRLDGGNTFTMRPRPVMVEIPYGGGWSVPAVTVADKYVLEGQYSTKLYQGPFASSCFSGQASKSTHSGTSGSRECRQAGQWGRRTRATCHP